MSRGYANWSMKSKVFSFTKKWAMDLNQVSEQVGTALNAVKSDDDVAETLNKATAKSGEIEGAITAALESFKADIAAEEASEEKKAEFEAALKAAAEEAQSKVSGVKIFSDIASLKVAANKKTREIKDAMSKAVVEATEDSKVENALKTFETAAKKIATDLQVDIAKETAKGKDLQKPEQKLKVDATQLPDKFVAANAMELLNNEDFMRKSGENVTAELTATLEKAKK